MNACRISFKNCILAIWNQLTRKGAWRNIFVTHNAFGIFSKYSHISRRTDKPKIPYPNKKVALKAAEAMGKKHGVHFSVYKCAWCDGWHVGKNAQNKIKKEQEQRDITNIQNEATDMEKQSDKYNLKRFLDAQSYYYKQALHEVQDGHKHSHWIWFIFPQLAILGYSHNAKYYGISGYDEAKAYLGHPILGERLITITNALLTHKDMDVVEIFGTVDAMKVRSCMTLFDAVSPNDVFQNVLDCFYNGKNDKKTLDHICNK